MPTIVRPLMERLPDGSPATVLRIIDDPRNWQWRDAFDALARQNGCRAFAQEAAGRLEVVVPLVDGPIRSVFEQMELAAALLGGSADVMGADQGEDEANATRQEAALVDKVMAWWEHWLARHPGGRIGVVADHLDPPVDPSRA